MSVLTLSGKKINWSKPPKDNALVLWSKRDMYGRKVIGSLRAIAHLDHTDMLARKKFGTGIVVIQPSYNRGVAASAGTHDYDMCFDVYIPGVSWSEQQKFFRANGWGAYWRRPPKFGHHIHMFSLPVQEGKDRSDDYDMGGFKVGKFVDGGHSTQGRKTTSAQIDAYYGKRDALASNARDNSWFPSNIKATIFDLKDYVKVLTPSKTVRWYEHRHLNTWGDDGGKGERTIDERRPQMIKDLTKPKDGHKPEVITLNEVKDAQRAEWRRQFAKAGYDTALADDGNLVAMLAGTQVTYSKSTILPDKVQGEGREEAIGRVRAKINGLWAHIIVAHYDYRSGAKFDNLRVEQAKATVKSAGLLAKYRPMKKWEQYTSIGVDENSQTWVRDKGFEPKGFFAAVKSGIDGIFSGRAARSTSIIKTASDHPIVAVTYGRS